MQKIVAIYCRESTEKQDIDTLVSLCEKKAIELGFKNYRVYKDIKSGYSNEREEYKKLIEDIKKEEVDTVIVYESSRLGRDELEHHILYKIFKNYNIRVYNMSRGWIDPNNEDDLFLEGILNLLDAREGRKTARRVKDRLKELCEAGKWTGGPAPLGYTLINKSLVVNPEEAKIVKEIFRLFVEGTSRADIAKLYNLDFKKVKRILKNPIYIGRLKYQQFVKDSNKKRLEKKEYITFKGEHEPIISDEMFEVVSKLLKNCYYNIKEHPAIFRGILYCGCGSRLYPGYVGNKRIYRCLNNCITNIYEEQLLDKVLVEIEKILQELEIENIENEYLQILELLKFYEKQIFTCEKQLENLTRKYIAENIKEELYDKLSTEINEKIKLSKNEIKNLKKRAEQKSNVTNNRDLILKYLEKIKKENDKEKINKFLMLVVDKIIFINSFRYKIYLKI